MKRIFFTSCAALLAAFSFAQNKPAQPQTEKDSFYLLSPVEVRAVRISDNAPFTRTNLSRNEISRNNLGQDIPFLLNQTPAVVVNSDAGNGIGYTGIRIRGTDATRINVTLNGIPYNDAESQGTFFVDLPDFSSSTGSIQVQRGVGSSSNGAGAFGASLNFSTNEVNENAYAEIINSFGSFNTWKNTMKAGSGLVNGFTSEVRFSRISSDGYIDRASSNLRSFYVTSAYISPRSSVRINVFSGKQKTYQAWYGISQADLDQGNRTVNYAGTEKPGDPYDNETDNYTQTHYQLFFRHELSKRLNFHTALFLTRGKGYYEQYKADQAYEKYGMPNPPSAGNPITRSDMVRQLWLDNYFYGQLFSFQYKYKKTQATLGGGYTRYDGRHFGKITWAAEGLTSLQNWYDLDALKTDFNLFLKQQTQLNDWWSLFYDLQYRHVNYTTEGFRDNPKLAVRTRFDFFNPKAGISFRKQNWRSYLSFGVANKEPNRDDFEAGLQNQPRPERLYDLEWGIEKTTKSLSWSATLYYMHYKDQLVLNGKINDVGAYTRTNIPRSYRAGIELTANTKLRHWLVLSGNLALSRNKLPEFTDYVDDYDNGGQQTTTYRNTDIAFSPSMVGGATVSFLPVKNTELSLVHKYVSRQYLDNTSRNDRSLQPFFTQDIRASYHFSRKRLKDLNIILQLNNIWNTCYEPNGYTFSYIFGGTTTTENYYFPMAGTHFMLGVNIKL